MLSSFPALVTVLALLLYIGVFLAAGRARGRYGVQAPAVTARRNSSAPCASSRTRSSS